ncbi:hypothetical protein Hdeb2414_s0028g00700201 [Helianthus debilis subsp. tardiflorus]
MSAKQSFHTKKCQNLKPYIKIKIINLHHYHHHLRCTLPLSTYHFCNHHLHHRPPPSIPLVLHPTHHHISTTHHRISTTPPHKTPTQSPNPLPLQPPLKRRRFTICPPHRRPQSHR